MSTTNEIGRSMIEMLGVLAIIGVLSVGGIAGYSKAMEKFKINKLIQQITYINNNFQTLYINGQDYDINTETAIAAGIIPEDMVDTEGNAINAFGGEVVITSGSNICDILFDGLPRKNMAEIGSKNWAILGNNLIQITICGSEWDRGSSGGYYFNEKNPPKMSDIIYECSGYDNAHISFRFGK